jgi:Lar family restriction alleviation protein
MELKPCPFCGSNTLKVRKGKYMWWVECCNMDCRALSGVSNLKAKAIEKWNRRVEGGA